VIGMSPAVMATRNTDSAAAGRGVAKAIAKIKLGNRLDVKRPGKIMFTSNETLPRGGLQIEYQTPQTLAVGGKRVTWLPLRMRPAALGFGASTTHKIRAAHQRTT
jgi:hypothetical protein